MTTKFRTIRFDDKGKVASMQNVARDITDALAKYTQPLTAAEVQAAIRKMTGHVYDISYTGTALSEAVRYGTVLCRLETMDERVMRAGGRTPRGSVARLYWLAAKGEIPARTEAVVVDGIKLDTSGVSGAWAKRNAKKRVAKRKPYVAPKAKAKASVPVNDANAILDAIIGQRVAALTAEIADLRDKLNAIAKITQA